MRSGTVDPALHGEGKRAATDNIIAGGVLIRKARRDAPSNLNLVREKIACVLVGICHDKHTSISVKETTMIVNDCEDFMVGSSVRCDVESKKNKEKNKSSEVGAWREMSDTWNHELAHRVLD